MFEAPSASRFVPGITWTSDFPLSIESFVMVRKTFFSSSAGGPPTGDAPANNEEGA